MDSYFGGIIGRWWEAGPGWRKISHWKYAFAGYLVPGLLLSIYLSFCFLAYIG
jgi:hypothetical protein